MLHIPAATSLIEAVQESAGDKRDPRNHHCPLAVETSPSVHRFAKDQHSIFHSQGPLEGEGQLAQLIPVLPSRCLA